uniref:Uncharacterized protein n=1 Tax=Rhizophora mucronata TaxID=61149 RepID=A0A2P2QYQ5_RHIMU
MPVSRVMVSKICLDNQRKMQPTGESSACLIAPLPQLLLANLPSLINDRKGKLGFNFLKIGALPWHNMGVIYNQHVMCLIHFGCRAEFVPTIL